MFNCDVNVLMVLFRFRDQLWAEVNLEVIVIKVSITPILTVWVQEPAIIIVTIFGLLMQFMCSGILNVMIPSAAFLAYPFVSSCIFY